MHKNNALLLVGLISTLFIAGCGKKKPTTSGPNKSIVSKKLAIADTNIPLSSEENLLGDEISDFAFIDNDSLLETNENDDLENDAKKPSLTIAKNDKDTTTPQDIAQDAFTFKTVQFDLNNNLIKNDQKPVVEQDCKIGLQAIAKGKNLIVEGHCCQIGSAAYNLALSQKRAGSIKAELVKANIPAERIKTVGFGYERPVVWSDAKNRATLVKELAPNRRAEVLVN